MSAKSMRLCVQIPQTSSLHHWLALVVVVHTKSFNGSSFSGLTNYIFAIPIRYPKHGTAMETIGTLAGVGTFRPVTQDPRILRSLHVGRGGRYTQHWQLLRLATESFRG